MRYMNVNKESLESQRDKPTIPEALFRHTWQAIVIISLCAGMLSISPQLAEATPRLTVPQKIFDFGFVPAGTIVTHEYWLFSTGSSVVSVDWTDASCPCAQLPIKNNLIEPGDSLALELVFDGGHYDGSITRNPRVQTSADPEPIRLRFDALVMRSPTILKPVGISPFRADLSSFGPYHQDTAVIKLTNHSEDSVSLELVYSRPDYFTVEIPTSLQAGESANALVILNPQTPEQAFEKSFTLSIVNRQSGADTKTTRLSVPVRRRFSEGNK